jgi:Zn-dependent protease with chaperone function
MNFFEDQRRAKVESKKLILAFISVTLLVAFATALAFVIAVRFNQQGFIALNDLSLSILIQEKLFLIVFIIISVFIFLISLIKIVSLGSDGASVASAIGAEELTSFTRDPDEKKYINIVEEMSIASGVTLPRIFILKNNKSINAFAAGTNIKNAAVCITLGAMRKLNREELQGVIAHEFSHIFNGDMKLNMRMIGVLGGLSAITDVGELFMRSSRRGVSSGRRQGKGGGGFIFLGLALYLIGSLGSILASILKAAFSREREYLADATSVQYTRNPEGIGGALKKIYADSSSRILTEDRLGEFSHMAFTETGSSFFSFDTHPKLETRLERIFNKPFPRLFAQEEEKKLASQLAHIDQKLFSRFEAFPQMAQTMFSEASSQILSQMVQNSNSLKINPSRFKNVAIIDAQGILYANALLAKLHPQLRFALENENQIPLLVYAFALPKSIEGAELKILALIDMHPEEFKNIQNFSSAIATMPEEYWLPFLEILGGKIKGRDSEFKQKMRENLMKLIRYDNSLNFKEFLLWNYLEDILVGGAKRRISLNGISEEKFKSSLHYLFFALSWLERSDKATEDLKPLYEILLNKGLITGEFLPKSQVKFSELGKKLTELKSCSLQQKEKTINLMSEMVNLDQRVSIREYELCRLVAHILGVPVAPVIPEKLAATF